MNLFGLPEISKELDEFTLIHRTKYLNIYMQLIQRCQSMTNEELSGYNEKHHILPKCMGGTNDKSNLVLMPVRYHIMAHIILVEIYPENFKLNYAIQLMFYSSLPKLKNVIDKHFSTRTISRIKRESVLNRSGENHPVFGNTKSDEYKQNFIKRYTGSNNPRAKSVISPGGIIYNSIKDAAKGENVAYSTLTKWLCGESSNHGWSYFKTEKYDFSNRNVEKSSKKVMSPDKISYVSIKEASLKTGIPYTTLRYWLSGRTKDNHGWIFI